MEIAIPGIALGLLYVANNQNKEEEKVNENFTSRNALPNTNIPDKNYPTNDMVVSSELEKTSSISRVNRYDSDGVYTDKYFHSRQNDKKQDTYDEELPFYSMTGEKVGSDYFKHNNMVPYFGSKTRTVNTGPNSNEGLLDNYTGGGSQNVSKKEQSPLFKPDENVQWANGMPNQSEFIQSRVNPSMRMANVKPFEEQRVAPGLGLGYTNEGSDGFNSGMMMRDQWMPKTADELEEFIQGLDLKSNGAKKSFVNDGNIESAKEYITQMARIRPAMRKTKLENAVGILNWIYEYNHQREIEKVVWGYREKPSGVPANHAGDIFIMFKNKQVAPKIMGISLKAGTSKSKEPKLNSYVGSTMRKPAWKKKYPRAVEQLKDELWTEVYSHVPNLPKSVTKSNYLTLSANRQTPNKILKEKMLDMFKYDNIMFEALYARMNKICREKLISMINGDVNATKEWIEDEFRLEKKDVEVPMMLVKAIGTSAQSSATDPLREFLPAVQSVKAYLKTGSVQEWFIDLKGSNNKTMTLTMTIRSDSEYREAKQKGKLGAFTMLKLLYRG